jgi:hypothetical protein
MTPDYAAPEVVADPTAAKTPATDMYSMGLLMFDLVFHAKHRKDALHALPLLEEEGHLEDVPYCPELADLLRLLLQADPAKRISAAAACDHPFFVVNADAVKSALRAFQTRGESVECSLCLEVRDQAQCTGCELRGDAKADPQQQQQQQQQHWLCHVPSEEGGETCFDAHILTCMEDNKAATGTAGLPCCMPLKVCSQVFPEASFRQRVRSDDAWAAYSKARVRHIEKRVNSDKDEEIKRRLEEWGMLEKHSRAVREYQQHIESHILTSRCPNSHPFHDFQGCFALACSTCNAHFCAYCLADCGDSQHAHAHVAAKRGNGPDDWTCPVKKAVRAVTHDQDAYFGSVEEFTRATALRVIAKLKDYLPTVPIELLVEVLDVRSQQLIADIIGRDKLDAMLRAL